MELHCEGEPCPKPVLRCKEVLAAHAPQTLTVYVDNDAAKDNVSRFLTSQGMQVAAPERVANGWRITATAQGDTAQAHASAATAACACAAPKHVVFLTTDRIGQGSDELGAKLMFNFLSTLPEMGASLWRIVLVNGGVRLATSSSPTLDILRRLEQSGVEILVCGTCLEFFGLLGAKEVGQTTNMLDVVTSLQVADKVISLG
ncbi:MAG: sulfurtransferase-like selenium metabolism protein YedF [Desulfomicrobiaceae bacterium]